jgi:hypothetical protein
MDRPSNQSSLFPGVEDREKRDLIKQALLRLEVIIPTIRSFQKNRIYLGIGANIVETLLLDEKEPKSIYKGMCAQWTAPETIWEEIREREYREVTFEQPDVAVRFCFMQVFLAALRHFPNLSDDAPKIESNSKKRKRDPYPPTGTITGSVKTAYKIRFLRHAQLLGFRTTKIINGLRDAEDLPVEVPESFMEDNDGEIIRRRSGTPYTNAYKQFRTQLFLTNLRQIRAEPGLNPSVMFIQRDFMNAFFGWTRDGGRDFALSTAPIPLFEPASSLERVLPGPVPSSRPRAVAPFEPAAIVEQQAEVPLNHSPRESVASLRSTISSEYTPVVSPQPRASLELSQEMGETWSQFSLPILDGNDSEGNELEEQRQRSLASLTDDRRSFPEPEDGDYQRRSFPPTHLRDTDWSPASIDNSERRSFPELEFRDGATRDDRRSFPESVLMDRDDEGQPLPTADLQEGDILSPALTDDSGRRSFPTPGFSDRDVRDERRSFPTADLLRTDILSLASTDSLGRRSFPQLELPEPELIDVDGGRRSFPAAEDQSTPARDSAERLSFTLQLPDIEVRDRGRSLPVLEPHVQRPLTNRELASQHFQHRPFVFTEHNGMMQRIKRTFDMETYLEGRKGWVMMVLKHNVLKTIRFKDIVEHMRRPDEQVGQREYFLIRRDYAQRFRTRYMQNLRSV